MKHANPVIMMAMALMGIASCVHVSSDPIEVKPIHITADINLRIDRKLDDFFAFEDKYQPPTTQASTTQPLPVVAQ